MSYVVTKEQREEGGKSPMDWLKECQFYLFGLVYTFARIALNINATMMPFFMVGVLGFEAELTGISPAIAAVPLITYSSSLLFTLYLQEYIIRRFANRLIPMIMALVVICIGSFPLLFIN